jgi:hypothetical protein
VIFSFGQDSIAPAARGSGGSALAAYSANQGEIREQKDLVIE